MRSRSQIRAKSPGSLTGAPGLFRLHLHAVSALLQRSERAASIRQQLLERKGKLREAGSICGILIQLEEHNKLAILQIEVFLRIQPGEAAEVAAFCFDLFGQLGIQLFL